MLWISALYSIDLPTSELETKTKKKSGKDSEIINPDMIWGDFF